MKYLKGLAVFAAYYVAMKVAVAPLANPILAMGPKHADGSPIVQL